MAIRAQGATEYLVLLAVVLIVALVSVALLGFFPGMASDAQMTQSQMYWQAATPLSIVEWDAKAYGGGSMPYFRVKNTGPYTVVITKILARQSEVKSSYWAGGAGYIPIPPGAEMLYGYTNASYPQTGTPGLPSSVTTGFWFVGAGSYSSNQLYASSHCSPSPPYGYLIVPDFGFEYNATIEGQTIAKKQAGAKPLAVKCTGPNY
jgi:hypothetical protein